MAESVSLVGYAKATTLGGPTGVKMTGPYEYVAPYLLAGGTTHGGAYGFNTETSPGPSPPPIESLERMLPEDHRGPSIPGGTITPAEARSRTCTSSHRR